MVLFNSSYMTYYWSTIRTLGFGFLFAFYSNHGCIFHGVMEPRCHSVIVFNCLQGQAPPYLVGLCQPAAGIASRQHLRSATWQLLVVPRRRLSSYGWRAFCVAGPSVWNSLPDRLHDPVIGGNSFRQFLKTFLFATYWCIQHTRGFTTMRYINQLLLYLLTVSTRLAVKRSILT